MLLEKSYEDTDQIYSIENDDEETTEQLSEKHGINFQIVLEILSVHTKEEIS